MSEIKTRQRKPKSEADKQLKSIRDQQLSRHVLEVELSVSETGRRHLLAVMEDLRVIRNTLVGELMKHYRQMIRTKRYKLIQKDLILISTQLKNLKQEDPQLKDKTLELKLKQKALSQQKDILLKEFNVTFDLIRKLGETLNRTKFTKPDAVTTWSLSDHIWSGMEKILYSEGRELSFYPKGTNPTIQGKQATRCLILKHDETKASEWFISFQKQAFPLKLKKEDAFVDETLAYVLRYLQEGQAIDERNVQLYLKGEQPLSTYRVCNNRIVHKQIRGKDRFFVQITLEGDAVPKRKKDGSFRQAKGTGRIGVDLGTSTVAYVCDHEVGLQNLAERSPKALNEERKLKQLQRKMNGSSYKTNLNNDHPDGRVKRGVPLAWHQSNRYQRLRAKVKDLHRKKALNRKYAIQEAVNHLLTLGDEIIIEPMNFKALQKKAKVATQNKKGRFNSRKRYGKSLLNRNPGFFKAQLKQKFTYQEVNLWDYRASQYDHRNGVFEKKKLSKRFHIFEDGTTVQRDLYSAFLLRCADESLNHIDQRLCDKHFDSFKGLHDFFVQDIRNRNIKLLNSGIKVM